MVRRSREVPENPGEERTVSDRSDTLGEGAPPPELREILLSDLRSCPTNPRKVFKDLEGLAASLREVGQIEPIVVREVANFGGQLIFEVVIGERRFRAAQIVASGPTGCLPSDHLGIPSLFAIVRELTDKQVLELQIAENNQRSDVHPLEEADAFTRLHALHGESVTEIAARIGRSERYIRDRMRLSSLVDPAKEAFLGGKLGAQETRVAFLLSRIPQRLQPEALKAVLSMGVDGDITASRVQTYLLGQYTLRLESAPFDPKDPKLTPAGACTSCPKRAGNEPELFPEIQAKETCTDPLCFAEKRKANYERREEEAQAMGRKVLSPKECAQIFERAHLTLEAPFIDLDASNYEDDQDPKKCRTWREILSKKLPPTVLARDSYGAAHDLLPREELLEALKAAGAKDVAKRIEEKEQVKAPRNKDGLDNAAAQKQKLEAQATREAVDAALVDVVEDCDKRAPGDAETWSYVLHGVLASTWDETAKDVAVRRGLMEPKQKKGDAKEIILGVVEKWAAKALRSLVVELLAARSAFSQGLKSEPFARACKVFGVDFKAHLAEARKAQKEAKPKGKRKKAEKVSDRSDTVGEEDEEPAGPPCRVCLQTSCELLGLPEEKRKICVTCDGLEQQIEDAILYSGKNTDNSLIDYFTDEDGGAIGVFTEERVARAITDLREQGKVYVDEKTFLRAKKRRVKPQRFRRSAKVR